MLNKQENKELTLFQRLVVQGHYIKYLKKGMDYFAWENEKKDTIIEMKEKEISELTFELDKVKAYRERAELLFQQSQKKLKQKK